jgi:hypothetical protein
VEAQRSRFAAMNMGQQQFSYRLAESRSDVSRRLLGATGARGNSRVRRREYACDALGIVRWT